MYTAPDAVGAPLPPPTPRGAPIQPFFAAFDPVWHGAALAVGTAALLWIGLCGALALFLHWRIPAPLWLAGLPPTVWPLQLQALSTLGGGREAIAAAPPAQQVMLRQALAGDALFDAFFALSLGLVLIASAGTMMALTQLFTGGMGRRWTWSQGGMGALVMVVGTALVLVFGLWGGAGGSALLLSGWLLFGALLFGAGCIRVEDDVLGRQHAGRVLLAYTVVAGTIVAGLAGVHLAQGSFMAAMAVADPVDAATLRLDAFDAIDTARKAGLVSVMMAVVASGSSTGGSLPQASDPRGTVGALMLFLGLAVFCMLEGAIASSVWSLLYEVTR